MPTVKDLKGELKNLGLATDGKKSELEKRLKKHKAALTPLLLTSTSSRTLTAVVEDRGFAGGGWTKEELQGRTVPELRKMYQGKTGEDAPKQFRKKATLVEELLRLQTAASASASAPAPAAAAPAAGAAAPPAKRRRVEQPPAAEPAAAAPAAAASASASASAPATAAPAPGAAAAATAAAAGGGGGGGGSGSGSAATAIRRTYDTLLSSMAAVAETALLQSNADGGGDADPALEAAQSALINAIGAFGTACDAAHVALLRGDDDVEGGRGDRLK